MKKSHSGCLIVLVSTFLVCVGSDTRAQRLFYPVSSKPIPVSPQQLTASCATMDDGTLLPLLRYGEFESDVSGFKTHLEQIWSSNPNSLFPEVSGLNSRSYHNWNAIQLPHELLRNMAVGRNYMDSGPWEASPGSGAPNFALFVYGESKKPQAGIPKLFAQYNPFSYPQASRAELATWSIWKQTLKSYREGNKNPGVPGVSQGMDLKKYVPLLCAGFLVRTSLSIRVCEKTLQQIVRDDFPSQNSIFFEDLFMKVYTDVSFRRPVVEVAQQLSRMFVDRKLPIDSHFNLLFEAFIRSRLDKATSIERALEVLAVLSVIGPDSNMIFTWGAGKSSPDSWVYPPRPQDPIYHLALDFLGSVPPALDIRWYTHPKKSSPGLSSLPRNVSMNCQFGKNYYFWLAAYFMWKYGSGLESQKDMNGVIAAVWILIKGYQKVTEYDFFDSSRRMFSVLEKPLEDVSHLHVRRDLSMAMAGMIYSKRMLLGQSPDNAARGLSVDRLILKLLNMPKPKKYKPIDVAQVLIESKKCSQAKWLCDLKVAKTLWNLNQQWEDLFQANILLSKEFLIEP